MPPHVFISYAWESPLHREWVARLAQRLSAEGIEVTLDVSRNAPGDHLPAFMERAVSDADFVLLVCTPGYKRRFEDGVGGVGYEGRLITGMVFTGTPREKFIPILREGSWTEAAPVWLLGSYYVDLRGDRDVGEGFQELLTALRRPPGEGGAAPIPRPVSASWAALGRDLTHLAETKAIRRPVALRSELRALIRILNRRSRHHALVVGASGVGKTALVEKLAFHLVEQSSPLRVLSVDPSTQARPGFAEALEALPASDGVVVALEDSHLGLATGGFAPLLALRRFVERPEVRLIMTTNSIDLERLDRTALESIPFSTLAMAEPSPEEAEQVVRRACAMLERHHGVSIDDSAIRAAIGAPATSAAGRVLPGRALDLLDEACSYARFPSTSFERAGGGGLVDAQVVEYVLSRRAELEQRSPRHGNEEEGHPWTSRSATS